MFKIRGITSMVIEGSVMQSAECFKITVLFSRNWLFLTLSWNHQNNIMIINASNMALHIILREEIFLLSQIHT